MLNHVLPLLVSVHNLTICLEALLENDKFETIGLVHLNTTVDLADTVHEQLIRDTNYAWMRYDMSDSSKLKNYLLTEKLFKNIFFVFFLDDLIDWMYVYKFFTTTLFNHRDNQIYVINKYPAIDYIKKVGSVISRRRFFTSALLFWNTSGHGSGLEAYKFNGFRNDLIKIPIVHDQCGNDIHNKIFTDAFQNFYGTNVTIFGATEPPKIVKTEAMLNGQYEYSISGHDVLITETVFKHLNATVHYRIVEVITFMLGIHDYKLTIKPKNNIEERIFNVTEISRYNWRVPATNEEYITLFTSAIVDFNSQQIRFGNFWEILHAKDYTYLYPHDTDNFIIVVPKTFKSKTEYDQILKSPLIFVWAPVTILATIFRYISNKLKKSDKNIVDIFIQTFGLSLGMSFSSVISSAAENLLLWWFCLGTMLSGILLSSSMFQGFALQLNILTISNLNELEMSKLHVQVPLYIESASNFFENIPQNLKLNYIEEYTISDMIFHRNTSNAYVIREGKFNILFGNDDDAWHIIQRFGFEHLSIRLRLFSSIENRMNTVIQRCVDHGIVKFLVDKNKRLLTGIRPKNRKVVSSTVEPVSLSDMHNPLLLYALGIVLSAITFIAEKIYFRKISIKRKSI